MPELFRQITEFFVTLGWYSAQLFYSLNTPELIVLGTGFLMLLALVVSTITTSAHGDTVDDVPDEASPEERLALRCLSRHACGVTEPLTTGALFEQERDEA